MIINKLFRGGGKIKDATATPKDVIKGKIFYNNNGRNVGTRGDYAIYSHKFLKGKYDKSITAYSSEKFYCTDGVSYSGYTSVPSWGDKVACLATAGLETIDREIKTILPKPIKFERLHKVIVKGKDIYGDSATGLNMKIEILFSYMKEITENSYHFYFPSYLWHSTNSGGGFLVFGLNNKNIVSISLANKAYGYTETMQDITVELYYLYD